MDDRELLQLIKDTTEIKGDVKQINFNLKSLNEEMIDQWKVIKVNRDEIGKLSTEILFQKRDQAKKEKFVYKTLPLFSGLVGGSGLIGVIVFIMGLLK